MYPSIIKFLNLCYTTLITNKIIRLLKLVEGRDYFRLPDREFLGDRIIETENLNNPAFVTSRIKEGILPRLERELGQQRDKARKGDTKAVKDKIKEIEARKTNLSKMVDDFMIKSDSISEKIDEENVAALLTSLVNELEDIEKKKQMSKDKIAECRKELERERSFENKEKVKELLGLFIRPLQVQISRLQDECNLLDARQAAIKVWMNSIYGVSGDSTNTYYRKEIATTVTATGRWMINLVKIEIEKEFCRQKGYPFDAKVIYGDTDSVMVYLEGFGKCVPEAFSVGHSMVKLADGLFKTLNPAPEFEFEKVYTNFNLVGAKNYFGLKWNPPGLEQDKVIMDTKGLKYIKRGPPRFLCETCKTAADIIVKTGDVKKARTYVRQRMEMLKSGEIYRGELVRTAKLSKELEKYGTKRTIGLSFSSFNLNG